MPAPTVIGYRRRLRRQIALVPLLLVSIPPGAALIAQEPLHAPHVKADVAMGGYSSESSMRAAKELRGQTMDLLGVRGDRASEALIYADEHRMEIAGQEEVWYQRITEDGRVDWNELDEHQKLVDRLVVADRDYVTAIHRVHVIAGIGLLTVPLAGGFAFSYRNWRCPACGVLLPRRSADLAACRSCGAVLVA